MAITLVMPRLPAPMELIAVAIVMVFAMVAAIPTLKAYATVLPEVPDVRVPVVVVVVARVIAIGKAPIKTALAAAAAKLNINNLFSLLLNNKTGAELNLPLSLFDNKRTIKDI